MSTLRNTNPRAVLRQANYALASVAVILIVQGIFRTDSSDILLAYLLVLVAAILPTALWIGAGAQGLPVLPVAASPYFVYFALPILRGNEAVFEYSPSEILRAGATVSLFLVAATMAARFTSGKPGNKLTESPDLAAPPQMIGVIFMGLGIGVAFQVALISDWLPDLGSFFGLARSVAFTFATVACFFLGVGRARGLLRGKTWAFAVTGLAFLILISWSTLFLVGGIMFCLTAVMGYIIVGKRVPWLLAVLGLVIITIFHAGKPEMRKTYWEEGNNLVSGYSVAKLPEIVIEWIGAGVDSLGSDTEMADALGRASLIHMLLRAQRLTPESVAFLDGETYALLPQMLMPRFLDPEKIASQAGMNLLNTHYGIQSERDTTTTAVGWGLVPEAYANFGNIGVMGVAIVVGAFCGALTRWSSGASAISLPSLIAIAAMVNLINMEADFSNLVTTLMQSMVAVLVIFGALTALAGRGRKRGPLRRVFAAVPRKHG